MSRACLRVRAPLLAELIIAAWFERKFEGENGSVPQAVAMRAQRASQFNRRQHRAVKTKPMAVLARGKTVIEDARQVFRGNPNSIINDRYPYLVNTHGYTERHELIFAARFIAGVLGIANQVHED